jgi:hypothetical protein
MGCCQITIQKAWPWTIVMGQIHTVAQSVWRIEESLSMGCCQITIQKAWPWTIVMGSGFLYCNLTTAHWEGFLDPSYRLSYCVNFTHDYSPWSGFLYCNLTAAHWEGFLYPVYQLSYCVNLTHDYSPWSGFLYCNLTTAHWEAMDYSHGSNSHSNSVGMTDRGIPLNGLLSDYNTESLTMDYSHGSNSYSRTVDIRYTNWATVWIWPMTIVHGQAFCIVIWQQPIERDSSIRHTDWATVWIWPMTIVHGL